MDEDKDLEFWRFKRLIQKVKSVKGDGTSLVSEIIPSGKNITDATDIAKELGTASNIKSRVNRQSVLSALTSLQHARKAYSKTPDKGLAIFCGEGVLDGKHNKWIFKFDDSNLIKPITKPCYKCHSKFETDHLEEMLNDDRIFGFIILDGDSCLFGRLKGKVREVVFKTSTSLIPSKTRRGGQSAARISRNREIAINDFIKSIAEKANRVFLTSEKVNVESIIVAGSASKKHLLIEHPKLDSRVKEKIGHILDISVPLEEGFNKAIEASLDFIDNLKFKKEKDVLKEFILNITLNNGLSVYGTSSTITALESGAVGKLIVWEDVKLNTHIYVDKEGKNMYKINNKDSGDEIENFVCTSSLPFTDWIVENYKDFGTKLQFVSNATEEGHQYAIGFGGIGGLLHYKLDVDEMIMVDEELEDDDFFF